MFWLEASLSAAYYKLHVYAAFMKRGIRAPQNIIHVLLIELLMIFSSRSIVLLIVILMM